MSAVAARVQVHRPLAAEDAGRANFYALFARLTQSGADDEVLHSLATAEPISAEGDPALAKAWHELCLASSAMDSDATDVEYDALFVGVGKAPVSIYAGHYTGAMAIDHPRVRLQADFAAFGLAPRNTTEPEDHLAVLFDVMRVLVAGGAGRGPASLEEQKGFFDAYLKTGAAGLFNAVLASPHANYYRKVAALGLAFLAIEAESFELDS